MLRTKKDLVSAGTEVQLQSFLFAVAMASGSCTRAQSKHMTHIPFSQPLAQGPAQKEFDQNHKSLFPSPLRRNQKS